MIPENTDAQCCRDDEQREKQMPNYSRSKVGRTQQPVFAVLIHNQVNMPAITFDTLQYVSWCQRGQKADAPNSFCGAGSFRSLGFPGGAMTCLTLGGSAVQTPSTSMNWPLYKTGTGLSAIIVAK